MCLLLFFSGQPPTSSYSYPAAVTVTSANMYAINPSSTTMAPNSTTVVSNHPSYLGKVNNTYKINEKNQMDLNNKSPKLGSLKNKAKQ